MSNFPSRVRECRETKGFTQKQMATEIGVSEILWRQYESGKRTPTYDRLLKLADYFGVTLDYLVGRSDDPTRR